MAENGLLQLADAGFAATSIFSGAADMAENGLLQVADAALAVASCFSGAGDDWLARAEDIAANGLPQLSDDDAGSALAGGGAAAPPLVDAAAAAAAKEKGFQLDATVADA